MAQFFAKDAWNWKSWIPPGGAVKCLSQGRDGEPPSREGNLLRRSHRGQHELAGRCLMNPQGMSKGQTGRWGWGVFFVGCLIGATMTQAQLPTATILGVVKDSREIGRA